MAESRIVSDPKILCGKPVIAGTRISVELILEEMGAGTSIDDLLIAYPHITRGDILTALRYAACAVRNDVFLPYGEKVA
ncbi:MAG: DUF433 domain-containing protein [Gemmataceae bacterium]